MTNTTISPLSVRQWKDEDHTTNKEDHIHMPPSTNHPTDDIDTSATMNLGHAFHVSAAQSLLLQQIIPTYAEMAHSFATHHTLQHLPLLLQQLQALANTLNIHLKQAIRNKIQLNGKKYPVEQAKGKMFKYTEYSQTTGITKQDGQSTIEYPNVYTGQETTPSELQQLQEQIREFAAQRDWYPFHTPRNLCLALGGELGELVEQLFLLETLQTDKLYQEVADVTIYLLRLADVCQASLFITDEKEENAMGSVLLIPVAQSQCNAEDSGSSSETVYSYPVNSIRNHIMQLWMHWAREDKERWNESLQEMCTLLNYSPSTAAATNTTSRLSLLCLLGELSDQFQFLGDEEQPLHKHTAICSYIQQMVQDE